VLDPGHGGDDAGTVGPGGAKEKDITLQLARRLRAAIEGRMGLRVLLTRDSDEQVTVDRRTAFANNSKADLFLSLHANASVRSSARGAQVFSLSVESYRQPATMADTRAVTAPVVGGGSRVLQAVEWDLAQLPFASRSAALGAMFVQHMVEQNVPVYSRPAVQAPMRVLVGANMPAVLLELGFLSNVDDEKALGGGELASRIVEAVLVTIAEVRRGIPNADLMRDGR